jgi:hypothetical protein
LPQYLKEEESAIEDMLTLAKRAKWWKTLDPSQEEALVHALTHRLAIIQGPPGCGKTFVGIKLVQLILSMDTSPETPILVLTYKNHALDEFLKGLLGFLKVKDIVRIGGRSKEPKLDECNLRNILRTSKTQDNSRQDEINTLKEQLRSTNQEVEELMEALYDCSILTMKDLLEIWTEEQLRNFLLCAPFGKTGFKCRLGKKTLASRNSVADLLAAVPAVGNCLLDCLKHGWNSAEERKLCMLFKNVLKFWMPSAGYFEQLKQLQMHLVTQMRIAQVHYNQVLVKAAEKEAEEADECDEVVVETILNDRLAAQGRAGTRKEERFGQSGPRTQVFFFNETTKTKLVQIQDLPPNLEENDLLLHADSLWSMNDCEKICLLYTALSQKIEEISASFMEALDRQHSLTLTLNELKAQQDSKVVSGRKVVGMTITGASIHHRLIQEVSPAVVLVEEAAEVLEADLLAALTPGLQHLVLIGDHKQLRPKVDTYSLRKDYNFDVSMMERLIINKFPFKTLLMQNRMRPEFSKLLLDIYPDLKDNLAKVERHRPAEAICKSMQFWNHDETEQGGQNYGTRGYANREEARRAVSLAKYLVATGITPSSITILAAYQGQVTKIRRMLHSDGVLKTDGESSESGKDQDDRVQARGLYQFQMPIFSLLFKMFNYIFPACDTGTFLVLFLLILHRFLYFILLFSLNISFSSFPVRGPHIGPQTNCRSPLFRDDILSPPCHAKNHSSCTVILSFCPLLHLFCPVNFSFHIIFSLSSVILHFPPFLSSLS